MGLWDYDDELPEEDAPAVAKPSQEVIDEDGENEAVNGKRKRKGSSKCTKKAPKVTAKAAPAKAVANADFDLTFDSDEDGGLEPKSKAAPDIILLDDEPKPRAGAASTSAGAAAAVANEPYDPTIQEVLNRISQIRKNLVDDAPQETDSAGASPLQRPLNHVTLLRPKHDLPSGLDLRRAQQRQAAGPPSTSAADEAEAALAAAAAAAAGPSDAGGASGSGAAEAGEAHDPDKIEIKCQCKQSNNKPVCIRIHKGDPFSKLVKTFTKHAVAKGWLPSADTEVRVVFDGDTVDPGSTPEELGMDDGDVVDMKWK